MKWIARGAHNILALVRPGRQIGSLCPRFLAAAAAAGATHGRLDQ